MIDRMGWTKYEYEVAVLTVSLVWRMRMVVSKGEAKAWVEYQNKRW